VDDAKAQIRDAEFDGSLVLRASLFNFHSQYDPCADFLPSIKSVFARQFEVF
jgi:hypothetical protein